MQAHQDNISAKVSGVLSPILGVSVTVTDTSTGKPAALYSDNGVTSLAQPLTTDETGYFGFYAANGHYSLAFSSPQIKLGPRVVQLYDPADDLPLTQAQAASPSGASRLGFTPAGTGAASRSVENKLRETVSVMDFGAKCDGVTDDTAAIVAGNEYLKANGGGTLYFPGWSVLNQPFYHYGVIVGGWAGAYPSPNQAKITWASNGQGGIKVGAGISSGDVIRLSRPSSSTSCGYKVGFQSFAIDCAGKNVTALNGLDYAGIFGANNYVTIDGLVINGIQGAAAIGVDCGTITDSEVRGLKVQGFGTGPYAGIRLNKTNVQLYGYLATYCINSIVIGTLTEACIQMFGGGLLACKQHHIYWESATADSKSSASIVVGAFIGETNNTSATSQGPIMGSASPSNLDIGVITFSGCSFDNWTTGTMMNIDWGGKFNFFGCNTWSSATGDKSIKFGQYCYAMMLNNKGISIDNTGAAVGKGQVQGDFSKQAVAFTPTLTASGATFNYVSNVGYYTKVGNLVTVSIRIQLATTGNTFTGQPLTLSGLPFPISNNTFSHVAIPCEWFSCATAMYGMTALLAQNGSTMALYKKTAATTSSFGSQLLDTDIGAATGGGVYVSFTYEAAAGA